MAKTNGQDPAAHNVGDNNGDLQSSDSSYVRNGRGVRQAHDGQVTGHDRNDRMPGRDMRAEATLKKNL